MMTESIHSQPVISIIIPCLNEEDYLGTLLKQLASQRDAPDFEVIVADSKSDDNTLTVAQQFAGRLPIKALELKKRGVSLARNNGAKEARGQWLLFLDADVRLPKERFLYQLFEVTREYNAQYATTHIRADSRHPFDRIFYWSSSRFFQKTFRQNEPRMTGAVMLIKRWLHQEVDGFDETQSAGEDVAYSEKIAQKSKEGIFIDSLQVICSARRFKQDGRLVMLARMISWNCKWWPRKWSFMDNYFDTPRHRQR